MTTSHFIEKVASSSAILLYVSTVTTLGNLAALAQTAKTPSVPLGSNAANASALSGANRFFSSPDGRASTVPTVTNSSNQFRK